MKTTDEPISRRGLLAGCVAAATSAEAWAQPTDRLAVDILLEPGPAMLERAAVDNARLRGNYPEGFALDAAHTPHVTVLQAFIDAAALPAAQAAAGRVPDAADPLAWRLMAIGRYYLPTDGLGLAGITIQPTPALLGLQAELIAAMAPYSRQGATAAAFDGPAPAATVPQIIAYIDGFVPARTGSNYNPHVTTGLGREDFVRAMVAEDFLPLRVSPDRRIALSSGNLRNREPAAVDLVATAALTRSKNPMPTDLPRRSLAGLGLAAATILGTGASA